MPSADRVPVKSPAPVPSCANQRLSVTSSATLRLGIIPRFGRWFLKVGRHRGLRITSPTASGSMVLHPGNAITSISVVMGRNALEYFRQQITRRRAANVAESEDADHPLVLVDHRQPADLQLLHVPHCFGEVIVLSAAMDAWGHHIPRCSTAGIEAVLCKPFADTVAISDHADKPVVLPDRNGANIVLPHQFREVGDRSVRGDPVDALVHHFFDFHGWTSITEVRCAL